MQEDGNADLRTEIEKKFAKFSEKYFGVAKTLPIPSTPDNCGAPHLELHSNGLISLVWTERGREIERLETQEIDVFLFWVFREMVKAIAIGRERENSHKNHKNDPRRVWFPIAVNEMAKISQSWANELSTEFDETLRRSPFMDLK